MKAWQREALDRAAACEERFDRLLDRLMKDHKIEDRDGLREAIDWAQNVYESAQYQTIPWHNPRTPDALDELAEHLFQVIETLDDRNLDNSNKNSIVNFVRLTSALASTRKTDIESAGNQILDLIEELAWIIHERVATVVPERDRRVVFGGVGDAVIEV